MTHPTHRGTGMASSDWDLHKVQDSVAEPCDVSEFQVRGGLDALKQVLGPSDGDRGEQDLLMLPPGSSLRSATNAATSPSMTVAFQFVSRRVVDATYLGMPFIRSMKSFGTPESPPVIVGYAADSPSFVTRPSGSASVQTTNAWHSRCALIVQIRECPLPG